MDNVKLTPLLIKSKTILHEPRMYEGGVSGVSGNLFLQKNNF